MAAVRLCAGEQALLGEGARWDSRRDELLHVDILRGAVFRDRVDDEGDLVRVAAYSMGETVGALAPRADGWVLAAGRGFRLLDVDGSVTVIADVVGDGHRMNDGACDPQGRFWAGSMASDLRPGAGMLHRLDADGRVHVVLDGLTCPNGIGWSPDGAATYFVDSLARTITAYAVDGDGLVAPRVIVRFDDSDGVPDGLTVDAEGSLWVAVFGAGEVRRYSPDGILRTIVTVPAPQVTSCALGGRALRTLYVTTATEHYADDQRRLSPGHGRVYRCEVDVAGMPTAEFG